MSKTVRVNVTTLANAKAVRREKRNGRDVMVVPSATLPDNVVMNGIMYPADEIKTSFKSLERTPAPLGHPMVNGKFVSARDPEAINIGHIGAWNENVRQEGGRVLLDKVIDVEVANRSEGGKAVIAAIEAGGPVHTSTGLLCVLEAANAADHKHIARSIRFDHDAILLNEAGAATPEKGVGMLVNAAGQAEEIEVVNSSIADDQFDWAIEEMVRAVERERNRPLFDRIKTAIKEAIAGLAEREPQTNNQENEMSNVSKEQFDALSAKVDSLADALKPDALATAIGNAVTAAVKPLTEAHNTLVANQKAKDDAELDELRGRIVKANLMDEASAKELTLNAARSLAKTVEPKGTAPLAPGFRGNSNEGNGFKLPKGDK